MSCLSAPCSAETVPPTARWLAVLPPLSECLSPSLPLCFGAGEFPSSLPQSKLFALVVAALADELVPWIVVAVGEVVHSVAAVPGLPLEAVHSLVTVHGFAVEGLVPVSSGCPPPAHSPLHFGPAACSLHTEDLLSAQIVYC